MLYVFFTSEFSNLFCHYIRLHFWVKKFFIFTSKLKLSLLTFLLFEFLSSKVSKKVQIITLQFCVLVCIIITHELQWRQDYYTTLLHKHYINRVTLSQNYLVMPKPWALVSKQIWNRSFKWGTNHWFWLNIKDQSQRFLSFLISLC